MTLPANLLRPTDSDRTIAPTLSFLRRLLLGLGLIGLLGGDCSVLAAPPRNRDELNSRLQELRRQYEPFLRSLPTEQGTVEPRPRQPIGPTWRMKYEVRNTTNSNRPEPPAWHEKDFDDSSWDKVDLPEWRYETLGGRRGASSIVWYRTRFTAERPAEKGRRVFLVFEGVDWEAHVWLNGKYLGHHLAYYEPFRFDVTDLLEEENTLAVRIFDGQRYGEPVAFWSLFPLPPAEEQRYVPDQAKSVIGHQKDDVLVGTGYGIHREVYLETTGEASIEAVFARGYPERGEAVIKVEIDAASSQQVVLEVKVVPDNFEGSSYAIQSPVTIAPGVGVREVVLKMPKAKTWSPEMPHLYRCQVRLTRDGQVIDRKDALFGNRSFALVSKANPKPGCQEGTLLLNGEPIFLRGTNINGFNALGYWGETDKLVDVLLMLKAAGFNSVRSCQHVCYPEVRELMDRLGIMSEQDQGGGRAIYEDGKPLPRTDSLAQLPMTGTALARVCYNNPGVVLLSFLNETWFTREESDTAAKIVAAVLAIDPDRIITPISGHPHGSFTKPNEGTSGYDLPDDFWGNVIDNIHDYRGWYGGNLWELLRPFSPGRMVIVGEYGPEALDGYETMTKNYPEHFGKIPPRNAEELCGNVQLQMDRGEKLGAQGRMMMIGLRGRRASTLADYIEGSQTYQADVCAEVTKMWRLSARRMAGYFHFHYIDVLAASWPKSIVSHDLCPKQAYYAMAQVNQPLVPLFALADDGNAMDLWVVNDLPEAMNGATIEWKVAGPGSIHASGSVPVNVPPHDAVRAASVGLSSVPETADVVHITLGLRNAEGKMLAQYEQEVFLRLWREKNQVWAKKIERKGGMRPWREIDTSAYPGSFVSLGDMTGDGRIDLLLSQMGPYTTPARLVAIDLDGKKLWELGDTANLAGTAGAGREPTCRGIAAICDVNDDGRSEVLAELWRDGEPTLCLIDGKTGAIKRQAESPLDMSVRNPKGYRSWRPVPMALIARLDGPSSPATIVLKYEASNTIPVHVVGLDPNLNVKWRHTLRPTAAGHIPKVADLGGDGRETVLLGETAIGGNGKIVWQRDFGIHADCTDAAELVPSSPGKEVVVSICQKGPLYCLSSKGETIWQKTREEVPHGQAVWAGDFVADRPGVEVIVLRSGHVGDFVTLSGNDGSQIAAFQHAGELQSYPDFPVAVRWATPDTHALWIPVDRRLVDGHGRTMGDLGELDSLVAKRLGCGESKSNLAAQAMAIDVAGDDREELVVYQPYNGRAVFIFTQADADCQEKPFREQPNSRHPRTYF
ncbi:MAG TPA: hypothetical protein DD670_09595 [Planctomycetaceae bacterium]|nr:hypothetical protein [Planctomycetaceae bacterium]